MEIANWSLGKRKKKKSSTLLLASLLPTTHKVTARVFLKDGACVADCAIVIARIALKMNYDKKKNINDFLDWLLTEFLLSRILGPKLSHWFVRRSISKFLLEVGNLPSRYDTTPPVSHPGGAFGDHIHPVFTICNIFIEGTGGRGGIDNWYKQRELKERITKVEKNRITLFYDGK